MMSGWRESAWRSALLAFVASALLRRLSTAARLARDGKICFEIGHLALAQAPLCYGRLLASEAADQVCLERLGPEVSHEIGHLGLAQAALCYARLLAREQVVDGPSRVVAAQAGLNLSTFVRLNFVPLTDLLRQCVPSLGWGTVACSLLPDF